MRFDSRSTALRVTSVPRRSEEAESFVRAVKVAAQQVRAEARERPRLCSQATVTKVTTVRPGVVRAKMRFEVTVTSR